MRAMSYFVYTYNNKKLNEKDVLYYRRTRIPEKDGDCIKDYYVRQQSGALIDLSFINLIMYFLFILM